MSAVPLAQHGMLAEQERDRLRRYIAEKVIGDNPPPLTAEAQARVRAALSPAHVIEGSSEAA